MKTKDKVRCGATPIHATKPITPVIKAGREAGRKYSSIAALLHHTCHPCHGYPKNYISADWPGAWSDGVRALLGSKCVPLVINGCCGNIHHANHLDTHQIQNHRRMGELLTQATQEVLSRLEYHEAEVLDWRTRVLPLPWRELPSVAQENKRDAALLHVSDFTPSTFQEAHELLAAHPEPIWTNEERTTVAWNWMYAVTMLDLEKQMKAAPHFDYEIKRFASARSCW